MNRLCLVGRVLGLAVVAVAAVDAVNVAVSRKCRGALPNYQHCCPAMRETQVSYLFSQTTDAVKRPLAAATSQARIQK